MGRLTRRVEEDGIKAIYLNEELGENFECFLEGEYGYEAMDKIAAYEDIIDEPEKLKLIDKWYSELCKENGQLKKELAEYKKLEEKCIKETTWGFKELLHKWKIFFDDMAELVKYRRLKEKGLLLELPCKVGGKAYHVIEDKCADPQIYVSEHMVTDVSAKAVYFAGDWWMCGEMHKNNAFFTREEAERALERMKAGA